MSFIIGTATHIKTLREYNPGSRELWRLDPPHEGHTFVVTSAVVGLNGIPELLIFGADSKGRIVSGQDLEGSCRGTLNHRLVMRACQYEVIA